MSAVQTIAVPPHNLEAEKSVLGAVLLDERHLYALLVEEHLRPDALLSRAARRGVRGDDRAARDRSQDRPR